MLVGETVFEILGGSDSAAVLVLNFEGDVSEHPDEFGHVPIEFFLVLAVTELFVGADVLRQSGHHFQIADGPLVDAPHRVVNEVRGDEQREGEDLGVCLGVFLQTIRALGVEEEDEAVEGGVEDGFGPHPDALRAALHCRVHSKLNGVRGTPLPARPSMRFSRQLLPVRILPTTLTNATSVLQEAIIESASSLSSTWPLRCTLSSWTGRPSERSSALSWASLKLASES